MSNLPKVVTQLCPEYDLNPRPVDRKSNTLPVAPPRHLTCACQMLIIMCSSVHAICSESNQSVYNRWYYAGAYAPDVDVLMAGMSSDGLVTVDSGGCIRLWETAVFNLTKSLSQWCSLIGDALLQHNLQVQFESFLCHLHFRCYAPPF